MSLGTQQAGVYLVSAVTILESLNVRLSPASPSLESIQLSTPDPKTINPPTCESPGRRFISALHRYPILPFSPQPNTDTTASPQPHPKLSSPPPSPGLPLFPTSIAKHDLLPLSTCSRYSKPTAPLRLHPQSRRRPIIPVPEDHQLLRESRLRNHLRPPRARKLAISRVPPFSPALVRGTSK